MLALCFGGFGCLGVGVGAGAGAGAGAKLFLEGLMMGGGGGSCTAFGRFGLD